MSGRGASWGSLLFLLLTMSFLGCGSLMVELDGYQVFNPAYRYFLTWKLRDAWQQPDRVLTALEIQEGDVVADVGAGNGYFVQRLSEAVGDRGHVFATDVQEVMLRDLRVLVHERELENVSVVEGAFDHSGLPIACCDLVLFANVYKEIADRVDYMQRLHEAMRPGGRIAILGFRATYRGPGPPPSRRLSKEVVLTELAAAGFVLQKEENFLPRQYFLVFQEASVR